MTLLPVVARELRVASRRSWTYWGRVVAGGMALLLTAWLVLVGNAFGATGNGEPLFYALAVPAFGFAFLSGMLYAADSISAEKREGTLGLLFLTDLRGHDVTLGKVAGTSLGAIYSLVAMLPFLALALLLGGITGTDYIRMILVLLTTLFASLATGVLASVLTVDARRSVLLAFLFMVVVVFGAPTAWAATTATLQRFYAEPATLQKWEEAWLKNLSPAVAFGFSGSKAYKTGAGRYWISIGFTVGVGILGVALASWHLPRSWQETDARSGRRGISAWLNRLRFPTEGSVLRFRRSILDLNPITWLTARHWMRRWLPWAFLGLVTTLALWMGSRNDGDWWDVEVSFALSAFVHTVLKLWMANEAPRQFLEDRRTGAMELLLSTPLTTAEILNGHWRALHRQFLGPMALVLLVDFFWMATSGLNRRGSDAPILSIVWLLRMVLLAADLWALGWAGFWSGMTGRGYATTTSLVFRILVAPWLLWFLLATVIGLTLSRTAGEDPILWLLVGTWFALALGSDLFWANRAKRSLAESFRETATRRPGEKRGWFRKAVPKTNALPQPAPGQDHGWRG
jgi:ABC-type transport system involved in multi-copper enzyme maturation permease subunit